MTVISLDDIQIFEDSKKTKMIQELRKDAVIISPDKGCWQCMAKMPVTNKVVRAHRTPKIYKEYSTLPPFRPIIETIATNHYSIDITKLTNPLAANEYSLMEAADKM